MYIEVLKQNPDTPKTVGWKASTRIGHPIYYRNEAGKLVPGIKTIKVGDTVYVNAVVGFFEAEIKFENRFTAEAKNGNLLASLEFDKEDEIWIASAILNIRGLNKFTGPAEA